MSASSSESGGSDSNGLMSSPVYDAVRRGVSADELRRIIENCARGSAERRAAAVNAVGEDAERKVRELPLQLAHRYREGNLVGVLIEAGADVCVFGCNNTSALALCIAHGQVDSLRALLRSGRHDVNERLSYGPGDWVEGGLDARTQSTAVHLCIVPPAVGPSDYEEYPNAPPPPRLAFLEALVREFGADVNARDWRGQTPLHWVIHEPHNPDEAIDMLVAMGADVNARDDRRRTPLLEYARMGRFAAVRRLLAHGASADVIDADGNTPLSFACSCVKEEDEAFREVIFYLLRHSSPQTRRAVNRSSRKSAIDALVDSRRQWQEQEQDSWGSQQPFYLGLRSRQVIAELLASGAPVRRYNARIVLPIAITLGLPLAARREAKLAGRLPRLMTSWRAHEAMVGLALDSREAREAGEAVESAQQRVEALEEELRELGCGTESNGEGEGEGEGEEEGEGARAGAGGAGSGGG